MGADDTFTALGGKQESHILAVVLKQILGEDGRTMRVAEDIETRLPVGVAITVVSTELVTIEVNSRRRIQTICQSVGLCPST